MTDPAVPRGGQPGPHDGLRTRLGLQPHPEGGWYRRTWAAPVTVGGARPAATAILFLLEPGESSAWHRVDADELWLWHGPGRLELEVEDRLLTLGPDDVQGLVPAGHRQRARPLDAEVLVTCVVSPGFQWSGFQLEP